MTQHKSCRISDFSFQDVPWAVGAYLIISLFSIGLGVFLESLPEFWSGLLLGAGCAFLASIRPVSTGEETNRCCSVSEAVRECRSEVR
jgi:hypothetical protein